MDSQGKPQIPRDLLERLAQHLPDQGQTVGVPVGGPGRTTIDTRRTLYRKSHLGAVRQMGSELGSYRPTRRPNPRPEDTIPRSLDKLDSWQNRPSSGFDSSQSRRYDPYA